MTIMTMSLKQLPKGKRHFCFRLLTHIKTQAPKFNQQGVHDA